MTYSVSNITLGLKCTGWSSKGSKRKLKIGGLLEDWGEHSRLMEGLEICDQEIL
jgi:hypothetical protein